MALDVRVSENILLFILVINNINIFLVKPHLREKRIKKYNQNEFS